MFPLLCINDWRFKGISGKIKLLELNLPHQLTQQTLKYKEKMYYMLEKIINDQINYYLIHNSV